MLKNKKLIFVLALVVTAIVVLFSIMSFERGKGDSSVIVKKNVKIINAGTDVEKQLIAVEENRITFAQNQGYEAGDVIVAGITDVAPNGFIRRVLSMTEDNELVIYETEYGTLLDVFEEAHIIKMFEITNESVRDVEKNDDGVMTLNVSVDEDPVVQLLAYSETLETEEEGASVKVKPMEKGLGIEIELNNEYGGALELNGKMNLTTYLEIKIDIQDDEIDFGMAVHIDTGGEIFFGCRTELFDEENEDFDGEKEVPIFENKLPGIQFSIGPVPVVITNEFSVLAEVSAQIEGEIGTSVGIGAERVIGFEYSSRTGEIQEINEKKYLSEGMQWETQANVSGELEAGIYAHLVSKLYDSTGVDLAAGIAGDVEGHIARAYESYLSSTLYGELEARVGPKIAGKLVVAIPVIDKELLDTEIFNVELPAFWKTKWSTADPFLLAMQNGDFSYFAGKYLATPKDVYLSGNGENIPPLELNEKGSLSGGLLADSFNLTPISVSPMSLGGYLCMFSDGTGYTICPAGIIDEFCRYTNGLYLKDVVYITYLSNNSITYYSDSVGELVTSYQGVDWVDEIVWPIPGKFVSGKGIQYETVGFASNGTILQTQDGKKWIMNTPKAKEDPKTGILYFDIMEYSE